MVYMNQALGLVKRRYPDKEAVPSGIFYYRIQDPLVEKGDDKETVKEKLLKELRPDGLISLEKILLHIWSMEEKGNLWLCR